MSRRSAVALLLLSLPLAAMPSIPEILSPEMAFVVSATFDGAKRFTVTLSAAPGYAIYRDKLSFEFVGADARIEKVEIQDHASPGGLGERHAEKLHGDAQAVLILDRTPTQKEPALRVSLQGCADALGVCLLPLRLVVHPSVAAGTDRVANRLDAQIRAVGPFDSSLRTPDRAN